MSTLAPALQAFFTDRLITQRDSSPHTIAAYRRDLGQFAEMAGTNWRDDSQPLLEFVRSLQRNGAKGSTQARKSAAVRSFYAFALREGLATRDIPALVDAPRPGTYLPAHREGRSVSSVMVPSGAISTSWRLPRSSWPASTRPASSMSNASQRRTSRRAFTVPEMDSARSPERSRWVTARR